MRKKTTSQKHHRPVRRLTAIAALLACTAAAAPVLAQQPADGQTTSGQSSNGQPQSNGKVSSAAALNFVGADIESVVRAVGHYTGVNFIIDPRVKGTISLVSEKPLTKAQAFSLLTSALRMQGYAVVMGDGYAKVVPEADAKLQPGPTLTKGARIKGDQIVTQIFRLNYESAAGMVGVLRPLIAPNNTINANPGTNSLIITDYADNLKRLARIIAALDAPATADIEVVPVQYAVASELAVMVSRLLDTGGGAAPGAVADAGRTSLLADIRTNSIVIRAPSQARANLAKSLIAKLDQPTSQPGNIHVVYLKNADAIKLAQTLRAVVAADASILQATPGQPGQQTQQAQASQPAGGANQQNTPATTPLTASPTAPANLPGGGAAGFIQADATTNTLIITASEPVYRNLRAVIDRLDARRAQVYIEAIIVEVSADKAAEFGVQWLGLSGDSSSRYRVGGGTAFGAQATSSPGTSNNILSLGSNAVRTGTTRNFIVPGPGLSVGLFRQINGQLGLGAIVHALESDANTNVLSTPNLITLDNEEARIIVGQNVPFVTGSYTTAASGSSNPFQTVDRRDVGLTLRVRPQISEGGSVRMAIYQEISSVVPNSVNSVTGLAGLTTNKRSIETNVLADDGQIVVLGGLIEDNVTDGVDQVPGFGDIPVFGNLFKYKTRNRRKTNLMVFLRPTVIRNSEQSVNLVADRYDYIRGTEIAAQPGWSFGLPDTGAPILPQLDQEGRPHGGSLVKPLASAEGTQPSPEENVTPMPTAPLLAPVVAPLGTPGTAGAAPTAEPVPPSAPSVEPPNASPAMPSNTP